MIAREQAADVATDNWRVASVGEVADVVSGYGFPKILQGRADGELPFFKVADISAAWKSGQMTLLKAQHYISGDEAKNIKARVFPKGTIVFAKIGEAIRLNRRAILGQQSIVDNNVMGLVPKEELVGSRYLYYWSQTLRLGDISQATTVPSVRKSDVEHIEIPLAPRHQQEHIVAEIEKQFSRLDEAVANLKRVKANLKRYKAAVLKAAVEGKLTEEWRKQHPDVEHASELLKRIVAERRQKWGGKGKYKEPTAPDTGDLPSLTRGWTWATVDQLAAPEPNSITDGPFGSNLKTEHYREMGPRVIRLQNIGYGVFVNEEAHISEEHFAQLKKHCIFPGDLAIAALGEDPPRSCLIPQSVGKAIVKADCIRFKPHKDAVPGYLNIALNSEPTRQRTKSIVHGVGRPRLNLGEVRSIVVPLPSFAEQQTIVDEVERRLSVIERLEAAAEAELNRADRLRQSILGYAFAGRLVSMNAYRASDVRADLPIAAEGKAMYGGGNS